MVPKEEREERRRLGREERRKVQQERLRFRLEEEERRFK
jgi:hypothetical protein